MTAGNIGEEDLLPMGPGGGGGIVSPYGNNNVNIAPFGNPKGGIVMRKRSGTS